MASVEEVLKKLKDKAKSDRLEGMSRYGMVAERRLGVSVPDMRKIAKDVGKDHRLALELWKMGILEAAVLLFGSKREILFHIHSRERSSVCSFPR